MPWRVASSSRLSALVLAVGASACCAAVTTTHSQQFEVAADDPALAGSIDRCFANDAACERLCNDLLGPPPANTYRVIRECFVNRDGARLRVHTRYDLTDKCVPERSSGDWVWPDGGDDPFEEIPDAAVADATPDE
jgi:hypothetical protein